MPGPVQTVDPLPFAMRSLLWLLTFLRLGLLPVVLWVGSLAQRTALAGGDASAERWTAVGILVLMGLSDVADGTIARRYGLATRKGAVVDAGVDKLVQMVLLVYFWQAEGPVFTALPLWFLLVIFGRDVMGLSGWLLFRRLYGPVEVVHRWHGRATTGAVAFVLLCAALGLPDDRLLPLLVATAALGVASTCLYFVDGRARGRRLSTSGS